MDTAITGWNTAIDPPGSPDGRGAAAVAATSTPTAYSAYSAYSAREAYEEDVRRKPAYDTGHPRIGWHQLGDVERLSWIRNPTPRDWTPPTEPPSTPQTSIPFYNTKPPVTG